MSKTLKQVAILIAAANRCEFNGAYEMAEIWRHKAFELVQNRSAK